MTATAVAITVLPSLADSARAAWAAGLGGHPSAAPLADDRGAAEASTPPGPVADGPLAAPPTWALAEDAWETPPSSAGTEPPTAAAEMPDAPALATRPRLSAAVAMGASLDVDSSPIGKAFVAPAFAGELGFGDGPWGFDLRLLSSQASGRTADAPPDRLAVDVMLAIRPWAARRRVDMRWVARLARSATVDVGLAGERLSAGPVHAYRAGLVLGARLDFPLTGASAEPGELRLRLGVRRMLAGEGTVGTTRSRDSSEALAGLVVIF